jgi:hypothetical protein
MTSDRKKPGVAFWATVVLVVVLVAYPLSLGPVCWINRNPGLYIQAPRIYWPLGWAINFAGQAVWDALGWYAGLGAPAEAAGVILPMDEKTDESAVLQFSQPGFP